MKIDKRKCRKYADPGLGMSRQNGLLHAEKIKHIMRTAVKNIGGQRILVLYVYPRERAAAGDFRPVWTMFQSRTDFVTLAFREDGGTYWRRASFSRLGGVYGFESHCAFYTLGDEERVRRFCRKGSSGLMSLWLLQDGILRERRKERLRKEQLAIVEKMKTVPAHPRDLETVMGRVAMPSYVFYTYHRGKKPMKGFCTACGKQVEVTGARHNKAGFCPGCRAGVVFKSRGKRGYIMDRGTMQVIQRISGNELVLRVFKAYYHYYSSELPEKNVYESARLFVRWDGEGKVETEDFYNSYDTWNNLTPWKCGERPVFYRWQYNFEADCSGHLYHKNLGAVLKGTPWQYSQLEAYYLAAPEPLCAMSYLSRYLKYPILEYLVKLRLYRLAEGLVSSDGYYRSLDKAIDLKGKNLREVLGMDRSFLPLLQRVNPDSSQMVLIKGLLGSGAELDEELLRWCSENRVGSVENLTVPLKHMTPHKLMRYAGEQFARFRCRNWSDGGYQSMENLLTDYKDYLCMSEALEYDMGNSFVLFPANLKEAHDKVNDLSDKEQALVYDRQIQKMSGELEQRYRFSRSGLVIVPPRSAKEIVEEGHKLHHCVGGYVKNVVRRNTTILFVRKTAEPDEPLCTVEVKDGKVLQARTYKNGAPSPEIRRFLDIWEKKVLQMPVLKAAA